MKLCFVDVETTGLFANQCAIHQLGMIFVDTILKSTNEHSWNVKPFEGASIHEKALEVSGVTREDLAEYDDMKSVGDRLKGVLDSHVDRYDPTDKMFFLAYNAPFDEAFFRAFMKRTGINHWGNYFWNPSVCVMQLAGVFLMDQRWRVGDLPNFKLETVYKFITGDDLQGAHDAMADIRATKTIFSRLVGERVGLG